MDANTERAPKGRVIYHGWFVPLALTCLHSTNTMLFGKKRSHRKFRYRPRYHNPEKEQKLKRRMRIKSKTHRGKTSSFLWLMVLLGFGLYLYFAL